jgi:S-layer homology domain
MKRTLTYALAAIFAAATVIPAFAQSDNFPDVPDNHWAYQALADLKKAGILVGYPDGLFRGPRPATRYEMAVAINAAFTRLKATTDGLDSQIKAINEKLNGNLTSGNGASAAELQSLKDALATLQTEVATLKGLGDDVSNLKRLATTFEKELTALGVDVEGIKKELGDLSDRVTKLEKRKPAVDISGDINLWLGGGNSRDDMFGLDQDGHLNGVGPKGSNVGLTRDLTILHEGAFTFAGTNDTGPKWKGTLVVGNLFGGGTASGFGNQSTVNSGAAYAEGKTDVYLQDFEVKFDTAVAGLAFNAEVGRVGYKVSPYIYQRLDNTSYFSNERWDNGLYYFDGGILGFNFGGAKIDVFAGKTLTNNAGASVNGGALDPVTSGPINGPFAASGASNGRANSNLPVTRQLGVSANIPVSSLGNLNLAYLWLDGDDSTAASLNANRLAVYGGSLDLNFGKLKVSGGYSQSDLQYNTSNINTDSNKAYNGKIGYSGDRFSIYGGYREVEANYLAPGDWGRLGVLRNPTNIKGFQVGGHLDITNALTLKADGEFDKGKDSNFQLPTGFNDSTKINKYSVNLNYKFSPTFNAYVGYEDTEIKDMVTGRTAGNVFTTDTPRYRWTSFGLGYGLSDAAKLSVQYQISDVKHDYQVSNNGTFKGGLLTTQLSVKF